MRKSKQQVKRAYQRLAATMEMMGEIDRCLLYVVLPSMTYSTLTARVSDLEAKHFLVQTGYATYNLDGIRSKYKERFKDIRWNPCAAPNAKMLHGEFTTKKYEKTEKWDLFKVLRFLERKN